MNAQEKLDAIKRLSKFVEAAENLHSDIQDINNFITSVDNDNPEFIKMKLSYSSDAVFLEKNITVKEAVGIIVTLRDDFIRRRDRTSALLERVGPMVSDSDVE